MNKQASRIFRFCLIAGLGGGLFADVAEGAGRSGRECRQDWRAHKAMYKQEGKSRRSFLRQCRAGPAPTAPATGTRTQ
jgi:hypothetical protein